MGSTAKAWRESCATPLTAAAFKVVRRQFNEYNHPRGGDGRWIDKAGAVRWKDPSGLWKRGTVTDLDKNGAIEVTSSDGTKSLHKADKLFGAKKAVATVNPTGFNRIGGQGGSNPGFLGQDPTTQEKWYVKTPKTPAHVANEIAAHRLYALVGVPTPDVRTSPDGSKFISKIEESVGWDTLSGKERTEALAEIRKNFVVDAWMGNWDASANGDNVRITPDGVPLRVDTGGALDFRAKGSPKPAIVAKGSLDPDVKELKSMIQMDYAGMYKGLTQAEQEDAVERILAASPDSIRDAVKDAGAPSRLADDMITRRAWLANHFGYTLPETTPAGKALLNPPAANSPQSSGATGTPSLAPTVKKLASGQAMPLAPGSPVWLKNKKNHGGNKVGDVWIVQSVAADKQSVVIKDNKTGALTTAPIGDFEVLRQNHASENAVYSNGGKPNVGDKVTLPDGRKGKITEVYPLFARFEPDGGGRGKVVAVAKTHLDTAAPGTALAPPPTGKTGLYKIPYAPGDDDIQAKYRAIAEAQVRAGKAPKQDFDTGELTPTQPEDQSLATGSGAGAKDLDPIVVRAGGTTYLLDGHHRAVNAPDNKISAHFVDLDAIADTDPIDANAPTADPKGKPFDFDAHFANSDVKHPIVYSLTHNRPGAVMKYRKKDGTIDMVLPNGRVATINVDKARDPGTVDHDAILAEQQAALAAPTPAKPVKKRLTKAEKEQQLVDTLDKKSAAALPALPIKIPYPNANLPQELQELRPGDNLFHINKPSGQYSTRNTGIWLMRDGEAYHLGGRLSSQEQNKMPAHDSTKPRTYEFYTAVTGGMPATNQTPQLYAKASEVLGTSDISATKSKSLTTQQVQLPPTGAGVGPGGSSVRIEETFGLKNASAPSYSYSAGKGDPVFTMTRNSSVPLSISATGITFDIWSHGTQDKPTPPVKLTDSQKNYYFDVSSYGSIRVKKDNAGVSSPTSAEEIKLADGTVLPSRSAFDGYVSDWHEAAQESKKVNLIRGVASTPQTALMPNSKPKPKTVSAVSAKGNGVDPIEANPGDVISGHANPWVPKKLTPSQALTYKIPTNVTDLNAGKYDDLFLEYATQRSYVSAARGGLQTAPDGTKHIDPVAYEFVKEQGGDANVPLLTKAQFDDYVAENNTPVLYRGVGKAAEKQDILTGTHFVGHGVYGNGTYSSNNIGTTKTYGRNTTTFTHRPDANIKTNAEVEVGLMAATQVASERVFDQLSEIGVTPSSAALGANNMGAKNKRDEAAIRKQMAQIPTSKQDSADIIGPALRNLADFYADKGFTMTDADVTTSTFSSSTTGGLKFRSKQGKEIYVAVSHTGLSSKARQRLKPGEKEPSNVLLEIKQIGPGTGYGENPLATTSSRNRILSPDALRKTIGVVDPAYEDILSDRDYKSWKSDGMNMSNRNTADFDKAREAYEKLLPVTATQARIGFIQDPMRYAFVAGIDAIDIPVGGSYAGSEHYYNWTHRNALIIKEG